MKCMLKSALEAHRSAINSHTSLCCVCKTRPAEKHINLGEPNGCGNVCQGCARKIKTIYPEAKAGKIQLWNDTKPYGFFPGDRVRIPSIDDFGIITDSVRIADDGILYIVSGKAWLPDELEKIGEGD